MSLPSLLNVTNREGVSLAQPTKSPTDTVLEDAQQFPQDLYEPIKILKSTLQGRVIHSRSRLADEDGKYRDVAIKLSSRRLATRRRSSTGKRVAENCFRELQIMRQLQEFPHPNVVRLYDYYADDNHQYMVLEYAALGELYDIVDKINDGVGEDKAREYGRMICRGMNHIHDHGIVHLDMSLENIFVTEDGTAKIGDFGVAKEFKANEEFQILNGSKPGKLNYMAPEIIAGETYNPVQADAFSFGVMLFIMLYGFPPFEEASDSDLRWQYIREEKMDTLLRKWNVKDRISSDGVDLLKRLIAPRSRRIACEDILSHPWFSSSADNVQSPENRSVNDRVRGQSGQSGESPTHMITDDDLSHIQSKSN